ncbi:MAG: zinc ribbon domain-containing protein [Methanoregula sp.]|jgi:rRNA maturation endonuclease Nob1|uniref:zinc ribbon domain-containing protein n=1 Tax=Methanoregula sp. TaxID=2052170 RepID=UPI003C1C560B
MARKCGSCGVPAPDEGSKFCNRCGSAIVDEPAPQFVVCSTCGAKVADPEAQFCDKCGGPIRKTIACPACGNKAVDENSKFCTRCGTTFVKPGTCPGCGSPIPDERSVFCERCGASLRRAGPAAAPVVVITKKRTSLPVQEETDAGWNPWSDGSPDGDARPPAPQEDQYAGPPPAAEEEASRAPQVRVPQKKYSHLPFIADELKDAKTPYTGPGEPPGPSKKERPAKRGVLGFLKR